MSFISVFDVLGPNMIGPSSSHTAGAALIAHLAHKLIPSPLKRVDFILYGSFARTYQGHGTDRALLGGILGFTLDDLNIRDSFNIARQRGLEYSFTPNQTETDVHPNTVDIRMENTLGQVMTVRGESLGGGKVRIVAIDGVPVDFTGEYAAVIAIHQDKPGVVAHITKVLSDRNVNIAFMRLSREAKGDILLVGHYGADNVGDDAALVRIADALGCDYRLHIVCKSKKKLGRICPHRGICRTDVLSIVRTAKKARAVIFGGGNLMQDITSRRSLFYYAALARVCRRYCGKLAVFSNGIGPLLHRRSEKYAEMLLAAANYISMRESDSARYARSLTAREDIRLGADIALIGRRRGTASDRKIRTDRGRIFCRLPTCRTA